MENNLSKSGGLRVEEEMIGGYESHAFIFSKEGKKRIYKASEKWDDNDTFREEDRV